MGGRQARTQRICFNPRARAGRDAQNATVFLPFARFNPRARAGRDKGSCTPLYQNHGFNPRARAGRDAETGCRNQAAQVSIHAPARGATNRRVMVTDKETVSIHAPARGATTPFLTACFSRSVSIHAPARGATLSGAQAMRFSGRFNPRARAGRDRHRLRSHRCTRVSIHAPARGATALLLLLLS